MIKAFCKKNWQIIFFNIFLFGLFICFYGRFGDLNVDSFREAYIPSQMLHGNILYKNIFTIYAPFSYLFNEILFFIFGTKLCTLYISGFLTTSAILNIFFKISERFINRNYALGIILFTISASVLSHNVFNMIFPYSFGLLYGILFILISVYFMLKGEYFGAYFMYSFAICSKYEFILFLPLLIWASGKQKMLKNVLAFLAPIFITFLPLFIQGLNFNDLILSAQLILATAASKSVHWFYSVTGLIFRPQLIWLYIINLIKILIPFAAIYFLRHWIIYCISIVYIYLVINQEVIIYIFPLILILTILRIRSIDKSGLLFVIGGLLISSKVFFALTLESYGIYFIPFALLSLFLVCSEKYHRTICILILICSLSIGIQNIQKLMNKNVRLSTEKGIFYTNSLYGKPTLDLIEFIKTNTQKSDEIFVYPEGLGINFLTDRNSDNKFYSLIPLYTEVFGEELIIQRLKFIKPEYIILNNYDTSNYYYSKFGDDYAAEIFKYIKENYVLQKVIGDNFNYKIYKTKL